MTESMVIVLASLIVLSWTLYRIVVFIEAYRLINARGDKLDEKGLPRGIRSLKPVEIAAFELFVWFFTQDANFVFHYLYNAACLFCLRNITPWLSKSITDEHIVHCCLNTSLVLYVRQVEGVVYGVDLNNIGWHSVPGNFDNRICIRFSIATRKIISFRFNDDEIEDRYQIFAIILFNIADFLHPMVHSYQNCLYESMKKAPKNLWRMAAHGNYLNESAHCYAPSPWIGFNGSRDWFEEILCEHATRPVPSHAYFDRQLVAASPFLTFVTKARTIVFQELKRAGLGMIDAEAYFLCSVLHSVDHWQMGKYVEWVDFDDNLKYTKRFNYMSRNFFQHSQYWFLPNNYFRSHYRENKLYERMYLRMKEADPMYADIISISVTY